MPLPDANALAKANHLPDANTSAKAEQAHWYIAIVKNNTEKTVSDRLTKERVEHYLPVQTVWRLWKNGRKAKVDRVVIRAIIFIHCTEAERRAIVRLPYIHRFMTDRALRGESDLACPVAIVSDSEIQRLRFMLGQSDVPVEISECQYKKGDKVKVTRGSLAGLEGEVLSLNPRKSEVTVSLQYFGCARLLIDTTDLELIK